MTKWMWRHKILSLLAIVLVVGSCSAVLGNDETGVEAPSAQAPLDAPVSTSTPTLSPDDEVTSEPAAPTSSPTRPPTKQEVWADHYEADRKPYVAAVAAALALRPAKVDAPAGALAACRSLDAKRDLDTRVQEAQQSFALAGAPTYEQALAALDVTTITICPEFATVHRAQEVERTKRLRAEERARQERERRRRARLARIQAAQPPAPPQSVYYANCTEVEDAGAAPIYAGDPGYSLDLDGDGDGVACEQ